MKGIFFVIAIAVSSFITNAQNANSDKPIAMHPDTPQSIAKRMTGKINGVCHLHGDQFTKVNTAYTDFYQKSEDLARQKLGKAKFNTEQANLKTKLNEDLKASLDPAQWQKWEADQKGRGK